MCIFDTVPPIKLFSFIPYNLDIYLHTPFYLNCVINHSDYQSSIILSDFTRRLSVINNQGRRIINNAPVISHLVLCGVHIVCLSILVYLDIDDSLTSLVCRCD